VAIAVTGQAGLSINIETNRNPKGIGIEPIPFFCEAHQQTKLKKQAQPAATTTEMKPNPHPNILERLTLFSLIRLVLNTHVSAVNNIIIRRPAEKNKTNRFTNDQGSASIISVCTSLVNGKKVRERKPSPKAVLNMMTQLKAIITLRIFRKLNHKDSESPQ
jgi:hypothetical protein